MKHRKFVKHCMAVGIQRNMANEVAEIARKKYGSYIKGLGLFLNTYAMLLNGQDPTCLYVTVGGGKV